jgi:hypothetical protein
MGESNNGGHTCAEPECNEPGRWRPIVRVFMERGDRVPGSAVLRDVFICDKHKDTAAKDIVESDDCWCGIVRLFAGHGRIARAKTEVLYEAVV